MIAVLHLHHQAIIGEKEKHVLHVPFRYAGPQPASKLRGFNKFHPLTHPSITAVFKAAWSRLRLGQLNPFTRRALVFFGAGQTEELQNSWILSSLECQFDANSINNKVTKNILANCAEQTCIERHADIERLVNHFLSKLILWDQLHGHPLLVRLKCILVGRDSTTS